jgi:hypothetical protein
VFPVELGGRQRLRAGGARVQGSSFQSRSGTGHVHNSEQAAKKHHKKMLVWKAATEWQFSNSFGLSEGRATKGLANDMMPRFPVTE